MKYKEKKSQGYCLCKSGSLKIRTRKQVIITNTLWRAMEEHPVISDRNSSSKNAFFTRAEKAKHICRSVVVLFSTTVIAREDE
ncbi:uncharacterized protein DS421_4g122600 [Arachis hypogaea]|nr:uncharacterized protein DS421_4g122600 [Arachis hypogaea]